MLFSVYYQTPENGEYLRGVVQASGIGQLQNVDDFSALNSEPGADVIFLEYQDNNPHLDRWIASTSAAAKRPEIFLYVREMSARIVWQALRLGARECFTRSIPPEAFRAAVKRVGNGDAGQNRWHALPWYN